MRGRPARVSTTHIALTSPTRLLIRAVIAAVLVLMTAAVPAFGAGADTLDQAKPNNGGKAMTMIAAHTAYTGR